MEQVVECVLVGRSQDCENSTVKTVLVKSRVNTLIV